MKSSLLATLAGASIIAFSSATLADGEACDSKKRGHGSKEMSTEAMKQFKEQHGWYSKDSARDEKADMKKDTAVKI